MSRMEIAISPMAADDLEAVLALWKGSPGIGLGESDELGPLVKFLDHNPGLSRVARHRARLVGAVLCGNDGRRGCLYHLAVLPEYRNQGVARRMIEQCLAALADRGILRCNAFVLVDNALGQRFWKNAGWDERTDLKMLQKPIG